MKHTKFIDKWFSDRKLRALDYQKDIILDKIPVALKDKNVAVLAACPSAGKTIMSICFIDLYLKLNPDHRVLVLTHGTSILRSQYHDEILKLHPSFSSCVLSPGDNDISNEECQVIVSLPQTLNALTKLPKFNLVVVDEAHQYYFATMVQDIIKKCKVDNQLLLTGTPSPFIAGKFDIIPVTVDQLLNLDMVNDLNTIMVPSTYDFTNNDFNQDYELKVDVKIKDVDTDNTLDNLMKELSSKIKKDKTLIACRNIEQSVQVANYFKNKNINFALSNHENDKESAEIARFKMDKKCSVLIVVFRGILGLNIPEMVNVVDMTTSQNFDRIFQLMCRVLRKHPNGNAKFFYKVFPQSMEEWYNNVMVATLCLTNDKYFSLYNGKDFMKMVIPNIKVKSAIVVNKTSYKKRKVTGIKAKSLSFEGLPSISEMSSIIMGKNVDCISISTLKAAIFNSKIGRYSDEDIRKNAMKYNELRDWYINERSIYGCSKLRGDEFFKDVTKHMKRKQRVKYSDDEIIEISKKYKTINDWLENDASSLMSARNNKEFYKQCTKHMVNGNIKTKK